MESVRGGTGGRCGAVSGSHTARESFDSKLVCIYRYSRADSTFFIGRTLQISD